MLQTTTGKKYDLGMVDSDPVALTQVDLGASSICSAEVSGIPCLDLEKDHSATPSTPINRHRRYRLDLCTTANHLPRPDLARLHLKGQELGNARLALVELRMLLLISRMKGSKTMRMKRTPGVAHLGATLPLDPTRELPRHPSEGDEAEEPEKST